MSAIEIIMGFFKKKKGNIVVLRLSFFGIYVYEFINGYICIIKEPGPKGKEAEKLGL